MSPEISKNKKVFALHIPDRLVKNKTPLGRGLVG
jgi:hypothetical protein